MAEMKYEVRKTEENRGQQLPNNRKQIGKPQEAELEVFIEDYAFSFAKGLAERDYTGCVVGVLVGEHRMTGSREQILVSGVLEARDVLVRDVVCFTEDNWAGIYRDIREYFPDQQIVGWYLGGPGFLLEDEERQKKIQNDNFGGGDKILLKVDSIEKEQSVLYYKEESMQTLPGYYIYYDKNEEMQNYIAGTHQMIPMEERTVFLEKESWEGAGRRECPQPQEPSGFYRLFYATSGVLTCLAILVIAGLAMQIQERDQLKELLNEQERQASSVQQVYIVEEGETLESICLKFYGSSEQVEAIRLLNSLEGKEEPEAGQKLFLP
ncbi:MAG: LysM peptidoglycan-binding domain-containing protein [Lachnospiraceae bacterium]|nr:LysM peptidoglycan-binding domain-containing protein [Lachnospiraceae bacterium]